MFVALCAAIALYIFAIRDSPESGHGMRIESEFSNLSSGLPPKFFDTGQPAAFAVEPSREAISIAIQDGRLVMKPQADSTAMGFVSTPDMGKPVREVGARWVFEPASGTNGALVLSICRRIDESNKPVGPCNLNLVITPENWNFSVSKGGGTPEIVTGGTFKVPLVVDGSTSYEVRAELDGGVAMLFLPSGEKIPVKDPRISQWAGNVATFAGYSNHGRADSTIGFDKVWADSSDS